MIEPALWKRISASLIALCLAVSFFCAAYPLYVIRPFRHQGARELAAALSVLQARNTVTAICAVLAVAAVIVYWRRQPLLSRRLLAVAGTVGVALFAALSRVNIYERMFHPLGRPSFESAQQTKLAGDEMVVAVRVNGAARAYPIRVISYHHIVNDIVGNKPIVSTY